MGSMGNALASVVGALVVWEDTGSCAGPNNAAPLPRPQSRLHECNRGHMPKGGNFAKDSEAAQTGGMQRLGGA